MSRGCSPGRVFRMLVAGVLALILGGAWAEGVTLLHVGDQESWLLSAQGNLRDDDSQPISYYGGIDRMAQVILGAEARALLAGRSVLKLNAGDVFLPGPRFNASKVNLATAFSDGGQDFYDAIAMRHIGFHASVFGNHEFDEGPGTAARFARVSGSTYLSANLDFANAPEFSALIRAGTVAAYTLVRTAAGHLIGIVGATTPLLPRVSSPGWVGLLGHDPGASDSANLRGMTAVVQRAVDAARAAGATTVVLISHLQNWNNEKNIVIPALTGVDIVLSGGGHERMANRQDLLLPGEAPTLVGIPQFVDDAAGKAVAVLTSNFGNRYVGELRFTLNDTSGVLESIEGARLLRVSGAVADTDRVDGDSFLRSAVVEPVKDYLTALNARVIGRTEVALDGGRGSAGSPGNFVPGVRNAETNLGRLVADAMRFAGRATVALHNGGSIRASVAAGDVSVGDTFNVLPFTNLVMRAASVSAWQLKQVLEHSVATASARGDVNGRFAQVSGITVLYDTRRAVGDRVRRILLDDGMLLVDAGLVVDETRRLSLATSDFTARGGDGYPFAALDIGFENIASTMTYQEALTLFISTPTVEGGLGGLISAQRYGIANPLDSQVRLVDIAIAIARGNGQAPAHSPGTGAEARPAAPAVHAR